MNEMAVRRYQNPRGDRSEGTAGILEYHMDV
jgi:hypothetical protein